MKTIYILISISLFALQSLFSQKTEVPLRFDEYYSYEEVIQAIKALNKAYPNLTKADLVGKSEEGREIWALTINNPKTGKELDKPGVYVDGNIHGNELQAAEVCLYFAQYMLSNYGKNEQLTKLTDRNAYYIVPTVNVDGRAHFVESGNTPSTNRGLRRPKDDDRDGLFDEDFPDDLNGDGNISQMRKKDPNGKYKTDPEEPRLMIPVEEGEQGEWTIIGYEGIDNDGDGRINEDSEGYVDGNRNWPHNWQPNYVQRGAGSYPLSGVGMRALSKYIMARPNIILSYAFHNSGGMFLRGPSSKESGPAHPKDVEVYDYLGYNAEKIVPGYRYLISWKDLYTTYGDFGDFLESVMGSYTFVGELFNNSVETFNNDESDKPKSRQERMRERLKFNDHLGHGTLYKDWEKYEHPQYGEIEIGGWVKYSSRLSHPFMLKDLIHRNASAVIFAAEQTPKVEMKIFEKKELSKGLYRIRVRLINTGGIPTMSHHSYVNNLYPKDFLRVTGGEVSAGGFVSNPYLNNVSYKEHKPSVLFFHIEGHSTKEAEFIVKGKGKIQLEYISRKAGNISREIKL
jgi:hypothetical protein